MDSQVILRKFMVHIVDKIICRSVSRPFQKSARRSAAYRSSRKIGGDRPKTVGEKK